MENSPFIYWRNATERALRDLAENIAPMELRGTAIENWPPEALYGIFKAIAARSRTYEARLDGQLAGICFVEDLLGRREMSFTKTRYLVESRRITFARAIPFLFRDLARMEREAGRDRHPMYMHVPDGDDRSREWFINAGCVQTEEGLLCPGEEN